MSIKVLKDMEIDEISLVDRPANSHAKVIISKRDAEEDMSVDYVYTEEGEVVDIDDLQPGEIVYGEDGDAFLVVDDSEDEIESEADETEEVGKKAEFVRGVKAGFGGWTEPGASKAGEKLGRGASKVAARYTDEAGKMKKKKFARDAGIGAGALGVAGAGGYAVKKSFSQELREEISKAVTEEQRDEVIAKAFEQMEEMAEYVAETEEIAKSERELRLIGEYEEVAKSYGLPVDDSELAVVLYTIAETLPYEHQEIIHKALSAAGEAVFMEYGTEGYGTNSDVLSAVDSFIDDNVSKSDISKAEAVAAVFEANPEAYEAYLAERYNR